MKANFFAQIKTKDKCKDLKESLKDMIQKVMDDENTPQDKMHKLARLRAYIDINLKDF